MELWLHAHKLMTPGKDLVLTNVPICTPACNPDRCQPSCREFILLPEDPEPEPPPVSFPRVITHAEVEQYVDQLLGRQ